MTIIPSPHPLDFDWRYDEATVEALRPWLEGRNVLALGAPSVARRLDALGTRVTLVDRQPFQGVDRHLAHDVEDFAPAERFEVVIADPPWYPVDFVSWVTVAGQAIEPSGLILASVWPRTARPSAARDLASAVEEIGAWADIRRLEVPLGYRLPPFEERAITASATSKLASSPCKGALLEIRPRTAPPKPRLRQQDHVWHRFILDDYQLALRLTRREGGRPRIKHHPQAKGWHWPFVSARAPGRDEIDLWSSAGEVAVLRAPRAVLRILQQAFLSDDPAGFEQHLNMLPELLHWQIPRPSYQRYLEWRHRQ